jgi:hypothetical protein
VHDFVERYERIHGAAHRRSAPPVGAPALSRQLVLTCDYSSYLTRRQTTKHHFTFLDWQFHTLKEALFTYASNMRIPGEVDLEVSNTFRQCFIIDGLFVRAILEFHRDHLKILVIVEFSPPADWDGTKPIDLGLEDPALDGELAQSVLGLRDKLRGHLESILTGDSDESRLLEASHFVRNEFWTLVDRLLCIDEIEGLEDCRRLLDLRGCLLAADRLIATSSHSSINDLDTTHLFDADANLAKATKVLWKFSKIGGYENNEFVCCTLFGKTSLYMSPIGSRARSDVGNPTSEGFTFFTMIAPSGSRWQVGRLLYRTNEVASLRLMALKDMHEILSAARDMKQLSSQIESLSDVENDKSKTKDKQEKIKNLKRQIDQLGISKNSADLAEKIRRSQDFATRFRQVVDTIDTGRGDRTPPPCRQTRGLGLWRRGGRSAPRPPCASRRTPRGGGRRASRSPT